MTRCIWIVRHGERVDNVNPEWKIDAPRGAWDDPPLTMRGQNQAKEVGYCLGEECDQIDFVFSSPFTRCLQTTTGILLALKKSSTVKPNETINNVKINNSPKIFVEPGFCESLNVCKNPPGYRDVSDVTYQFPMIDSNYSPFMSTENLPIELTSLCCFKRVQETLAHVIRNYKGNILIVSHGSPISACHAALTGEFKYVGQCTISKYVINSTTIQQNLLNNNNNNNNKIGSHHLNVSEKLETKNPHNNNEESVTEDIFTINEDSTTNNNNNNNNILKVESTPTTKPIENVPRELEKDDKSRQNSFENYPFTKSGKLRQDLIHFEDIKSDFSIKCLRVGDSAHLSDRKNLRDRLRDLEDWKQRNNNEKHHI